MKNKKAEVRIATVSNYKEILEQISVPHAVISICSEKCEPVYIEPNEHCLGILLLIFDDVTDEVVPKSGGEEERKGRRQRKSFGGKVPGDTARGRSSVFDDAMAQAIAGFVLGFSGAKEFIVQSEYGVSRAAAVAAAIDMAFGGDGRFFFSHGSPNRMVYRILSGAFRKRGRKAVSNPWKPDWLEAEEKSAKQHSGEDRESERKQNGFVPGKLGEIPEGFPKKRSKQNSAVR